MTRGIDHQAVCERHLPLLRHAPPVLHVRHLQVPGTSSRAGSTRRRSGCTPEGHHLRAALVRDAVRDARAVPQEEPVPTRDALCGGDARRAVQDARIADAAACKECLCAPQAVPVHGHRARRRRDADSRGVRLHPRDAPDAPPADKRVAPVPSATHAVSVRATTPRDAPSVVGSMRDAPAAPAPAIRRPTGWSPRRWRQLRH